eukprot:CAMPEP_0115566706 /NCGR_PEP_ID=MMETSP0271-20121206/103720_1 /TAXON_ID=71861 /ORGANISM="Scrippsiella trochoidea, Strain CCMP3099" /LENGTH=178 /DNA_ID=CAMNT_0003001017 /DNA_START=70 /DNA_END=605 /DNA_ORIENTATION=-
MTSSSMRLVTLASSVPLDTSNNPNDMGVTLFKTEMCRLIQTGGCRRKFCRFAHSEAELRPKPDLMKTRPCHFLLDRGYCRNRQCGFAHNAAELRKVPSASSMRGGTQEIAGHLQRAVPRSSSKLQLVRCMGGEGPASNSELRPKPNLTKRARATSCWTVDIVEIASADSRTTQQSFEK